LIIRAEITGTAILDGAQRVTRWVRPSLTELEVLTPEARQRVYVGLLDQRVFPNLGQLEAWQAQNENHTNRLPTAPEVFEGNERMNLAQWPNTGTGAAVTGISPNNTRDIPAQHARYPRHHGQPHRFPHPVGHARCVDGR